MSPNNPFGWLRHVGTDAAGAIQVLPEGIEPADAATRQGSIEWLSDDALETMLAELAQNPQDWDSGRDTAANEKQIPELLRGSAVRIADLVTAHVERRRDKWGRVDPT